MSHDYVKRAKKNNKTVKKPVKQSTPGWMMLLYGMASGFVVAVLAYLFVMAPKHPQTSETPIVAQQTEKPIEKTTNTQATKEKTEDKKQETTSEAKTEEGSSFEFYTLLPESEVIVPNHEETQPETQKSTTPTAENINYILQAGSFRSASDADKLRARLLLMGLEAKIQTVSVGSGETWHRVQVGPFKSTEDTKKAQTMLTNANIETLLLKLKP